MTIVLLIVAEDNMIEIKNRFQGVISNYSGRMIKMC